MQLDSDKHSSLLYSILSDEERKLSNIDTKLNFGNGPPHLQLPKANVIRYFVAVIYGKTIDINK